MPEPEPLRDRASARLIFALAAINIGVHIAAMAFAGLGMRPGTPGAPLEERIAFLASAPPGWTLGWGAWMLCALADAAFIAAIATHAPPERASLAAVAVAVVIAGAAVDLVFDTIHVTVIPRIAAERPPPLALFLALERMAWAVGLIVANTFYSAATLLVTLALGTALPPVARWAGFATFAGGMALCAAGFTGVPRHVEIASGPTIAAFVVWTFTSARALARS